MNNITQQTKVPQGELDLIQQVDNTVILSNCIVSFIFSLFFLLLIIYNGWSMSNTTHQRKLALKLERKLNKMKDNNSLYKRFLICRMNHHKFLANNGCSNNIAFNCIHCNNTKCPYIINKEAASTNGS